MGAFEETKFPWVTDPRAFCVQVIEAPNTGGGLARHSL